VRLRWRRQARSDLRDLAQRAPAQAAAVYRTTQWLAEQKFSRLGRPVAGTDERYWPVPPQGIFYWVGRGQLVITRVLDTRRRREPW
jgi:plasmid stabilization system protein ParE